MSEPRTNDAEYFCTCTMQGDAFVPSNAVPADFARQLERELAAATARVGRLEEALRKIVNGSADSATEDIERIMHIARAALGEMGGR